MEEFLATYPPEGEVIAVGVSGGADSLALVLRLQEWASKHHKKIVALTVDHRLRPESAAEAAYVAQLMSANGIEHHILVWENEKPQSGIEEAARLARYDLLLSWCREHGVKTLAIGHHRRDQAETFLLRLQRGSGLYGLSAMLPKTFRSGVCLIRPQLNDSPESLQAYLRQLGITWVEDPSNQCLDFQRVRMRKFLPELEAQTGISEQRLAETAAVLARTRAYFEEQINSLIQNYVRDWHDAALSISKAVWLKQHSEIRYLLMTELLRRVSGQVYAPEAEEVLRLSNRMQQPEFSGATLGGCEIWASRGKFWLTPEIKDRQVMSKAEWEKCLHLLPQYAKADLPYKVRRAIYNHLMKKNNGKKR